jgi:hypoxanthine phosphoribosyltransferase
VQTDIEEIVFSKEQLDARIAELGASITSDYSEAIAAGEQLVVVCILRGAAIFTSDLVRSIDLPLEMDYMAVSSYGNAAKSSGMIRIQKDLSGEIAGKHVIIVEDVIDSGLTLDYLRRDLASRGPLSIESAALLRKDTPSGASVECKYVGFSCPDKFIVGYGLDYAQRYRNLPYIAVLKPEIYE